MLKSVINDFLSLIYPNTCPGCKTLLNLHESVLCTTCYLTLPQCWPSSLYTQSLENRFKGRIPFETIAAYFVFEKGNTVQHVLHSIKYRQHKTLARQLGVQFAEKLQSANFFKDKDLIIPVPLHISRQNTRGFNQSELFAQGVSEKSNIPLFEGVLSRSKATDTQTRKQLYQRWLNVEDVFTLKDASQLENKHVVLIDDVITTGATLEAVWIALKQVPNVRISILALAYAANS